VVHLLLLFFGLSAAYDESPIKSLIYSLISLIIAISLFILMTFVTSPVHLIVTIMLQMVLVIIFTWYASFVRREHLMNLNGGKPILIETISDNIERSMSRESYRS
jgi:ABC-type dipeptide/oligopeptide/nickel transport system permease subunit